MVRKIYNFLPAASEAEPDPERDPDVRARPGPCRAERAVRDPGAIPEGGLPAETGKAGKTSRDRIRAGEPGGTQEGGTGFSEAAAAYLPPGRSRPSRTAAPLAESLAQTLAQTLAAAAASGARALLRRAGGPVRLAAWATLAADLGAAALALALAGALLPLPGLPGALPAPLVAGGLLLVPAVTALAGGGGRGEGEAPGLSGPGAPAGLLAEARDLRRLAGAVAVLALCDLLVALALAGPAAALRLPAWAGMWILAAALRHGIGRIRLAPPRRVLPAGQGLAPGLLSWQLREASLVLLPPAPLAVLATAAGLVPPSSCTSPPPSLSASASAAGAPTGAAVLRARLRQLSGGRAPGAVLLVPGPGEAALAAALVPALRRAGVAVALAVPGGLRPEAGLGAERIAGLDLVLLGGAAAGGGPPGQAGRIAKRGLDIGLSAAALVLLAPLFACLALLLRAEGGPVLFRQARIGRGGRRFSCLKFRSMHPGAERGLAAHLARDPAARAEWARHQKLSRDPRVTPLGRLLRESALDELPQLWNVLRGEMSLIGPRPVVAPGSGGPDPFHAGPDRPGPSYLGPDGPGPAYPGDRAYAARPEFGLYLSCRPGLSGLWQVSGGAGTPYEERIRLDAWYVRNWSLWLDLALILRTVSMLLARRGGR